MTVSVCYINMSMQVQDDSLNAGRFVVWLLLLYFMRHEKQNIKQYMQQVGRANVT